jgi:1-deoxy-D-xylulose-5-phosphate synthase
MCDDVWKVLGKLSKFGPNAQAIASKIESGLKAAVLKNSNLFESLNLRYFGPVDGHNANHLVQVMRDLQNIPGPKILHCITVKGKGYALAEKDQVKWHAPGTFDKTTGAINTKTYDTPQAPKYQDVFGKTIIELAEANKAIMGITPAMPSGCSLNLMMEKMPDRALDVGIAEQHAVTFSAGLATQGLIPFCNIYSSFMQRAYDQVIHDVALQNLHVIFCLDRAGIAGADGPTHHGAYDIAYMRCIPNMVVMAPMNEHELRHMMYTAQLKKNAAPFSIRYPRGQGVLPDWKVAMQEIEIGKGRVLKEGSSVAVLSLGHVGNFVQDAIKPLSEEDKQKVGHYDLRFVKPLDENLLHNVFKKYSKIITIEDGCLPGGFGSAVLEFMSDHNYTAQVVRLGMPDRIVEHGEQPQLHKECGYDAEAIFSAIKKMI